MMRRCKWLLDFEYRKIEAKMQTIIDDPTLDLKKWIDCGYALPKAIVAKAMKVNADALLDETQELVKEELGITKVR